MSTAGRQERAFHGSFTGLLIAAAVVLQAFAPHHHDVPPTLDGEPTIEAHRGERAATGAIYSSDCIACRTSQQIRHGIIAGAVSLVVRQDEPRYLLARETTRSLHTRLHHEDAAPRAPPLELL